MMLKWLKNELFGGGETERQQRRQARMPILPTPDGRPVPLPIAAEPQADTLPPVKRWSHPFRDKNHPLHQLTHLAKAAAGYYPLGISGLWHGGVHFDGGTAGTVDQSSVHCLADGEVVAYRIDQQTPTTGFWVHTLPVNKPFSRSFVLVRHRLQPPKIEGSPDTPPSLTFYSLYMHLQDWAAYQDDAKVARPLFWPEGATRQVGESANDANPKKLKERGLNIRNQAKNGAVIGFLPHGAQVAVSGAGDFRKLENTQGPETLQNSDGSLKGYVAASFLQPIADGQYRVVTQKGPLNVRAEGRRESQSIGQLHSGTEVTVSGDGEYRKLERINQYVHFASLQGAREPEADRVVVLEKPIAVKAGDLIGHIGWYQDSAVEHPEQRLHLEVFSPEVVDSFIEASRAWAQRLPPSSKTWLKLAKGTPVIAHQDRFNAQQPPSLKAPNTPSAGEALLPKTLLDGLPADKKIKVCATDGNNACTWYRVDGVLHDAENNLLNGWVCEDSATTWVSPWSWENHEVIYNWDGPRTMLASFRRATGQMNEAELQRFGSTADLGDTGPLKTRLHDLIDRNGDGVITAKELQAALSLPALAQSISQLIIYAESEWKYTPYKWDGLDELVGYSNSTPLRNWLAEKERVQQICWWDEVAGKLGLPEDGKVYHLHPVGLVGCFTASDPLALTSEQLKQIFPRAAHADIDSVLNEINDRLFEFKLDTRLRQRHFFAQIKGEVGDAMKGVTESWEYSPAALQSFSSYYLSRPVEAASDGYLKDSKGNFIRRSNQQAIGRKHFQRLNGNRASHPDDGFNFRGRGLIQITGYEKYSGYKRDYNKYWKGEQPNTVDFPELINEMPTAIRSAIWFWIEFKVYASVKEGGALDVERVTKKVNGGKMGLEERTAAYEVCEKVLI
ncbi:hypothetical protein ABQX22_09630 [Xanthomonas sp. WHRI 1810A]|uniref:hypothetical protein n=1 Tax=Xanthomonas sp. WHRI 1810A TaxID=3161565 RepID=UPI0032E8C57E